MSKEMFSCLSKPSSFTNYLHRTQGHMHKHTHAPNSREGPGTTVLKTAFQSILQNGKRQLSDIRKTNYFLVRLLQQEPDNMTLQEACQK